jgi:predicted DNA-binding protein YlxM (UPF0122 family)
MHKYSGFAAKLLSEIWQMSAARKYWIDGWKMSEIAKYFHVTRGSVLLWTKKFPKYIVAESFPFPEPPLLSKRQMIALYAAKKYHVDKWKNCDIAREYNVSPSCVSQWVKKYPLSKIEALKDLYNISWDNVLPQSL